MGDGGWGMQGKLVKGSYVLYQIHIVTMFMLKLLLNHHQHSSVKGKSYLTNLLETYKDWTKGIDQNKGVGYHILNSVPHRFQGYGIANCMVNY